MKKSRLILLALFVLILNLIWEFSHYRLYFDLTGIPSTLHLIMASLTDLLLISFIFSLVSLFRKNINWIKNPKKLDYIIIIIFGVLIASAIEFYSTTNNRWAYTDLMPTIFGIGISPLIQLFTTAIVSLILIRFVKNYTLKCIACSSS